MSIVAMSHCWGENFPVKAKGVSSAAVRLVALSIADVVNDANDNEFYGSVTRLAAKVTLSRETVGLVLKHLVEAGVLDQLEERPGGTTRYRWNGVPEIPSPLTDGPDGGDGTSRRDTKTTQPSQGSSLRSEELDHRVAREYWLWYVAEHPGLRPTIVFPALRKVASKLLEAGHQPDDIVDAMKTARSWTSKSLSDEIARKRALAEERPTTVAIPHALVRAFAKAEPFFARRHPMKLNRAGQNEMMVRCSMMLARGFDVGETMIRLSLVLRAGDDSTWALANVECPRFPGELDDYADSMERAWTNRRWNVS
jgi:hypothetical protein